MYGVGGTGNGEARFSATGFVSRILLSFGGDFTLGPPSVTIAARLNPLTGQAQGAGAQAVAIVGQQTGSTIVFNPQRLIAVPGGSATGMITTGGGDIVLEANNEFSYIQIDQPITTTGTGQIRITAGHRPAEGYAVRLNANLTTNTGNINFSTAGQQQNFGAAPPSPTGLNSTSDVLLAGTTGVNITSTGGGSVFFSSMLDAVSRQDLQINTSGSFTVYGNIGSVNGGLGDIILGNQLSNGLGLSSLWFNAGLIAESLTINNSSSFVRNGAIASGAGFNGVLIVGTQTYNNVASLRPALDLRTVGALASITMQDQVTVITSSNTDGEIFFTTSNQGSVNLLKGLSTGGNLTISNVSAINLGNPTSGIGSNDITISVNGSNGLTFNNPLNLIGNVTLAVATTKDITLNQAVNGGNDLHFSAPGGDISVAGSVGQNIPLRNIILRCQCCKLDFHGFNSHRLLGLSTNGNFVTREY